MIRCSSICWLLLVLAAVWGCAGGEPPGTQPEDGLDTDAGLEVGDPSDVTTEDPVPDLAPDDAPAEIESDPLPEVEPDQDSEPDAPIDASEDLSEEDLASDLPDDTDEPDAEPNTMPYAYVLITDLEDPSSHSGTHTAGVDLFGVELIRGTQVFAASEIHWCVFGTGNNQRANDCNQILGLPDSRCDARLQPAPFVSLGGEPGSIIVSFGELEEIQVGDQIRVYECGPAHSPGAVEEYYSAYVGVVPHPARTDWVTCLEEVHSVKTCTIGELPDVPITPPCGADDWCDPECEPGEDPDCAVSCHCDYLEGICDAAAFGSTEDCPCDPDCGEGNHACGSDGVCDYWCPFGVDPDCDDGCYCDYLPVCDAAYNGSTEPCPCDPDCDDDNLACAADGVCDIYCDPDDVCQDPDCGGYLTGPCS